MAVKKSKATDPNEWVEIARAGLDGIASPEQIGEFLGIVDSEGVTLFRFASNLSGYPGWEWTVALYAVDGVIPTVLEAELLAGDESLLAPAWVPWSERLEIWKASQEAGNVIGEDDEADDIDDFDGLEDDDEDVESDSDDDFDDEDIDEDLDEVELLNPGTDHQLDEVVDDLLDDESEDDYPEDLDDTDEEDANK